MNNNVKILIDDLSNIPEVDAILLAGSYGTQTNDENSDYDVYIYTTSYVPINNRKDITNKYFKYIEISNTYWEEEDDGILFDNTEVELIYRNIDFLENSLYKTLIKHEANMGYSTCLWSNLQNSIILYDKNEKLTTLKNKYNIPYPDELRSNIIEKNIGLLKDKFPCYYTMIEKSLKRNDYVNVNHKLADFLSSYFDIIFAFSRFPHPGEKKLLQIIKDNNLITPKNMEKNVINALKYGGCNNSKVLQELNELNTNLKYMIYK